MSDSKLMTTKKGLSALFEIGTIYGKPVVTKVFGTACYGFRVWVGSSSGGVSLLRQMDSWYLPIEGSKALADKCRKTLTEGTVVAVTGERKTFARYSPKEHMLTSVQVNIGRKISVCGYSDKATNLSTELERLKATDRMYTDTMEDISDELAEEQSLVD